MVNTVNNVFAKRGFDHPSSKHLVCSVCGGIHYAKGFCRFHYLHPSRDINKKPIYPNKIKSIGNDRSPIFVNRAKKIFPFCCDNCKSKKNVCLHHRDGNTYNNPKDASNWQFLCSTCHKIVHIYGKFPTLEEMNKIKNERVAESKYQNHLKMLSRAIKRNIPPGYITTKEAALLLNVSRERMRQIKHKIITKEINRKYGKIKPKNPVRLWLKTSVVDYKIKRELRITDNNNYEYYLYLWSKEIGVQASTLKCYISKPSLILNQSVKAKIENYFLQGYPSK